MYSAYCSEIENTYNFNKLGFAPPFHEPTILRKSPDFILINDKKNYCLIIECKSGIFQTEDDIEIAESYNNLKLREVEDECKKIMQNRNLSINNFDVAFQYYNKMILKSEKNYKKEFEKFKSKVHIINCKIGDKYFLYTNKDLVDKTISKELKNGFRIPEKPDPRYYLTNKADDDLIAHAIISYGLKQCSFQKDPIIFDMIELNENLFGHYQIRIGKIKKVLQILEKLRVIEKHSDSKSDEGFSVIKYQFTKKTLINRGIPIINQMFEDKNIRSILASNSSSLDDWSKENIDVT